jgi:hypothetical protein
MTKVKRIATMFFSAMALTAVALVGQVASPNVPQADASGYTYYTGDGVYIRRGGVHDHCLCLWRSLASKPNRNSMQTPPLTRNNGTASSPVGRCNAATTAGIPSHHPI